MWKSNGWIRNIGIALLLAGQAMKTVPSLAPFAEIAVVIGTSLAGLGLANVGVNKLQGK